MYKYIFLILISFHSFKLFSSDNGDKGLTAVLKVYRSAPNYPNSISVDLANGGKITCIPVDGSPKCFFTGPPRLRLDPGWPKVVYPAPQYLAKSKGIYQLLLRLLARK